MRLSSASVRVMRSHDYCHFEVVLGAADYPMSGITTKDVDDLRKEAMRLADKAVDQYATAKRNLQLLDDERREHEWEKHRIEAIRAMPEHERSAKDAAALKAFDDLSFKSRPRYDYQDDWEENP